MIVYLKYLSRGIHLQVAWFELQSRRAHASHASATRPAVMQAIFFCFSQMGWQTICTGMRRLRSQNSSEWKLVGTCRVHCWHPVFLYSTVFDPKAKSNYMEWPPWQVTYLVGVSNITVNIFCFSTMLGIIGWDNYTLLKWVWSTKQLFR